MKICHYVMLNPTGNLTALVLDHVAPEDERFLTRELLKNSEQVAYMESPTIPRAEAAIRLMGGEFCGNATMASAAWILRNHLSAGEEKKILLQVSGTSQPVSCHIKKTEECFQGTVLMPTVQSLYRTSLAGRSFTAVKMEGILHLIHEDTPMDKTETENLLRDIVSSLPDDAVGLLQWDRTRSKLLPLIFVRGSNSMVWEHGCGSGSAAIGAHEAFQHGDGITITSIHQPGGTITADVEVKNGTIISIHITGFIHLGQVKTIELPELC